MNWTGGRLQRSTANANTLGKTQKQHFAKARLRLQSGRSTHPQFAFSISPGQDNLDTPIRDDMYVDEHHRRRKRTHSQEPINGDGTSGLHSPVSRRRHNDSLGKPRPKRHRSEGPLDHRHGNVLAAASTLTRGLHNTTKEMRPSLANLLDHNRKSATAEANTLQNVKLNLLKRSDWMGLSAARPLRMAFTTVEGMKNIGKRRRITEADGRSKPAALPESRLQPVVSRRHRMHQKGSSTSILHTEDASVRIGANIHQTQTTPLLSNRERPMPSVSQSVSTESMLLDKLGEEESLSLQAREAKENQALTDSQPFRMLETSLQAETGPAASISNRLSRLGGSRSPCDRAPASCAVNHFDFETAQTLPTLDKLRDSKSFDELKARSATKSSKRLTRDFPTLTRPITQAEIAQNDRRVDSYNSIVSGQRPLPSWNELAHPASGCSVPEQLPGDRENSRDSQPTRTDPDGLSSGLRPGGNSQSKSHAYVNDVDRGSPYVPKCKTSSFGELSTSAGKTIADRMAAPTPLCQRYPRKEQMSRPVFTLEQQVCIKARAGSPTDAHHGSSSNSRKNTDSMGMLSSATRPDQSWTESSSRSGQYWRIPHLVRAPSSRPDEAGGSENTADLTEFESESPATVRAKDRHLNVLNGSIQGPSQNESEARVDRIVIPSPVGPASPKGAFRTCGVQYDRERLSDTPSQLCWSGAVQNRPGDENEALMESVVPGFSELRAAFEFEPQLRQRGVNGKTSRPQKTLEIGEMTRMGGLAWRPLSSRGVQTTTPTKSIQTSANTVLYTAEDLRSSQPRITTQPSETDFLTQMSPMEGKLDERLVDISVYNNAAQSIRSFVAAPSLRTHSRRPLLDDSGMLRAYVSGHDTTPFRHAIGSRTLDVRDTRLSKSKARFPKSAHLLGSRSTHRQPLQPSTELQVVTSQPFPWPAQAKRTQAPPSGNPFGLGLTRPFSQSTDVPKKTPVDLKEERTPRHMIRSFPSFHTPVRRETLDLGSPDRRMPSSDYVGQSQAYSVQRLRSDSIVGVQRDELARSSPIDHKSALRDGKTRVTSRPYDTGTFDEYPFADEAALYTVSTDHSETDGESAISGPASSRPGPIVYNIHTDVKPPFIFKKPRPFVGIKGSRGCRDVGFEVPPPLDAYGMIGSEARRISAVDKYILPDKAILVDDSEADDIESASNM